MTLVDKDNKIILFSGIFLFLIPFLSFLQVNTYEIIDQLKFVYSALLIFLLVLFISISILIFKITKINFFIVFFFINLLFFLQFYFNFISITLEDLGVKGGASLETLIFIFLFFISLIFFQYKKKNFFLNSLLFMQF